MGAVGIPFKKITDLKIFDLFEFYGKRDESRNIRQDIVDNLAGKEFFTNRDHLTGF